MAHMDLSYLERFCKGDGSRMHAYLRMYLDGAPDLFRRMEERVAADDGEGLAQVAHSLRPQVHFMGARALFELLTTLEDRARSEGAAACRALLNDASRIGEELSIEVRAVLPQA